MKSHGSLYQVDHFGAKANPEQWGKIERYEKTSRNLEVNKKCEMIFSMFNQYAMWTFNDQRPQQGTLNSPSSAATTRGVAPSLARTLVSARW